MKKVTFAALAALTITACSSGPKFQVNGDVSGADGKMLYLEASGLEGIVPLDSVKLKGKVHSVSSSLVLNHPNFIACGLTTKSSTFL